MMSFFKKLVALLVMTIIVFAVAIIGLLIQTFNISSSNSATIIAGIMGMLGGFVGAMGAYLASITQMEKQFEKQDRDRLIEINLKNFNETLILLYDFYNYFQKLQLRICEYDSNAKEEKWNKPAVSILEGLSECHRYKNDLKKYEVMTRSKLELQKLYEKIDNFVRVTENYCKEMERLTRERNTLNKTNYLSFGRQQGLEVRQEVMDKIEELRLEIDEESTKAYGVREELEKLLNEMIDITEKHMESLLNIN